MPSGNPTSRTSERIAAKRNLSQNTNGSLNFNPGTSNPNTNNNTTSNATNHTTAGLSNSAPDLNATIVPADRVVPLMSMVLPAPSQHPTSSPENNSTFTSPEFSSLTAQAIRSEYSRMSTQQNSRQHAVGEEVNPNRNGGENVVRPREENDAPVGTAQTNVMKNIEQSLAILIPRIVRESIRSEMNSSFNHSNQNMNAQFNHTQPTYFNNTQHTNPPQQQQYPHQQPFFYNRDPPTQYVTQNIPLVPNGYSPFQLAKWGIHFNPANKTISVEEFVFRAESLRLDYNCPWDVFIKGFHHLLEGSAENWIWNFRHENPRCDWGHLKYQLIKKFRNFESDFEIQTRIVQRRQQPSESADAYISDIIRLRNQMRIQLPEYEIIRTIKDNLKEGLVQLIFSKDVQTIEELLEECKRAERSLAKRGYYRPMNNYKRINEVAYDDILPEEEHFEVEALKPSTSSGSKLVCWNCKKVGHNFIDCSVERGYFCYRCGFDGVKSCKDCPQCRGNGRGNMAKSGLPCSPQN